MADGMNKPAIRFAGFTDAWEQRKYGEVVETRRGLTYKPSDICDSGIRVLRSSNIDEDTFVLKADDVFVKKDAVNIDYSKENDILITSANGSSRLVGKHAIISSISGNPAVHGGFMLLGTTKEPYFITASMGSSWYRRFIELYVAGGNGAIGNLNKNDLDNQAILIPSEPEQQAIGAFFKRLDHLITLHQRKYFYKFTSAGTIRTFQNTNAWEQRKFEDLYDYASEGGTPDTNNPAFYEGGKIPFVKIEDTVEKYIDSPKSYITEEGMNHSSAWLIPKGNVIFTNGATVGNVAINRLPVTTKQGILGIIPSKKVTSEFLFYLLSSTEFQREVRSRMATGTFATIILKSLNEIPVCFPSNTNEQESIITILSRLDNLITLHQRERILHEIQNN